MILQAKKLPLHYANGHSVQLDIDVAAGGWEVILAPSGTGKSAAASILAGLAEAKTSSLVKVLGKDLMTMPHMEKTRATALLPAQPFWVLSLIGETVEDEIDLGAGFLGEEIPAERMHWIVNRLGLHHLLNRDARTLSVGECVRVSLAVILARAPIVLILDQALDSCDFENRKVIRYVLAEWLKTTGGAVVEFATSWQGHEPRDLPIHMSALTVNGWVQGTPDTVWGVLGSGAANFFDGLAGLAAHAPCQVDKPSTRFTAMTSLALRLKNYSGRSSEDTILTDENVRTALRIKDLSFAYGEQTFSLNNIDLAVPQGSLTAVLGSNGAGKTTFLRCLANLLTPWTGLREVDGQSLPNDLRPHQTAFHLLYAFQNPDDQIYRSSVAEELIECRRNLRPSDLEFSDLESAILDDLEFQAEDSSSPFSLPLSRRRLLMIASTLLARSPVALLDEPTVWLDLRQKKGLGRALRRFLDSGGTAVMVSHDLDFVGRHADRILRLEQGRVAAWIQTPWASADILPEQTPAAELADQAQVDRRIWREPICLQMLQEQAP